MDKSKLQKYASLKKQIKDLEAEVEGLNAEIVASIEAAGADKVDTEFGTFSLGARKSWTYPSGVQSLQTKVKEAEKEAQQLGTASFTEKKYLIFKGNEVS